MKKSTIVAVIGLAAGITGYAYWRYIMRKRQSTPDLNQEELNEFAEAGEQSASYHPVPVTARAKAVARDTGGIPGLIEDLSPFDQDILIRTPIVMVPSIDAAKIDNTGFVPPPVVVAPKPVKPVQVKKVAPVPVVNRGAKKVQKPRSKASLNASGGSDWSTDDAHIHW